MGVACECSTPDNSGAALVCSYPDCPFGEWEDGEQAVLCTHADPSSVVHRAHKDCAQEAPHPWDGCGVVQQPVKCERCGAVREAITIRGTQQPAQACLKPCKCVGRRL